jgi:membrane protein
MSRSVDPIKAAEREPDRGRSAHCPGEIPLKGWWDIAWRVQEQLASDNVSIVAGGLALFGLLSIFPSLAAAVAICGLIASPEQIAAQSQAFAGLLPAEAMSILLSQLNELATRSNGTLSLGAVVGILLALWSARRGMVALITAMNVAYNEYERRGFFRRLALSLLFTVCGVVGFLVVIALAIAVPVVLRSLPLGAAAEWVLLVVRWALLWYVAVVALSALYRFAPHRSKARWQWLNVGARVAASVWLFASILFAVYVRNFGSFGQTYGAIGGVVILLFWFYISAFVVILGAEINSELERQTVHDTTVGEERPIGQRGAFAADTVGPRAGRTSQAGSVADMH